MKLSYNYVESENSKQIIVPYIITSDFKGVNELLKNEANVHNLFENVKVYEENVPKAERIYEQYLKEIEEEAK